MWTREQVFELCRKIEAIAPTYGAHVALTGGLLYKDGERKDADILFYRIRQVDEIDVDGLLGAMARELGVVTYADHGWVIKAVSEEREIDFFFPERKETPAMAAVARARGY